MQFLSLRVNKLNHKREGKFSLILFRLILVDLDLPYNYFQLVTIFSIYLKYSSVPTILANKRYLAYAIENYLAGLFYLYSVRTAAWARDFDWVHNKKNNYRIMGDVLGVRSRPCTLSRVRISCQFPVSRTPDNIGIFHQPYLVLCRPTEQVLLLSRQTRRVPLL